MSRTRARKPPASPARNRKWLFLGIGAAVAIAAVLALALTPNQPVAASEYGPVSVSGSPLPIFTGDPGADAAVGTPAPEISGVDFQGSPISISDDGRPKVLLFLAHWCPHCQREVPAILEYLASNDFPEGVDIYSVATASLSDRPNWPPSAWLAREGWSFPVMADDEESSAFRAFGQGAFPYYVFIDSQGNVALRLSGEQDMTQLAVLMESLAS